MGAKTIALDSEAYALLKAQRKRDESFSDLVKRHFRPARRLADFAGAWSDVNPKDRARFDGERQNGRAADLARAARIRRRSE
ncbi:MAG TPA: antitoxin VapB family protein [Thermoplasmata archaeon]|nr:antitoxin VapB family protein [Thermoplasmata archaeon]